MKKLLPLLLVFLLGTSVSAQEAPRDWVFGFSAAAVDFNALDGQGLLKTSNWNGDIGPTRVHLTKKITPRFAAVAEVTFMEVDKLVTPVFPNEFTELGLGLRYNFANGKLLRETNWFDPYIGLGGGLMNLNKENYMQFGANLGTNLWISDRFGVNFQTGMVMPSDYDNYLKHSAGIVLNLGNVGDRDGDGIADAIDKCPDEPGIPANMGCPAVKAVDEATIQEIAKNIYFNTDSDVLKPESITQLDLLVDILNRNPHAKLSVEGHTDNTGDAAHNLDLSKKRAAAVVKYLVEHGIGADRLKSEGYGETMPATTNDTPEGRARNRRVELKVFN